MPQTTDERPWDLIVIGAGAAGLLAAARAAELGRRTLLLEKNRKPGAKILMSGGTRCNITQNTDRRGIIEAFGRPGRFLHSALAALDPPDLVRLLEAEGLPTKVEETGKIFPGSDKAYDVLAALLRRLNRSGAVVASAEPVTEISRGADSFHVVTPARTLVAHKILITTGGQSYPGCGTTGDAYSWAAQFGHTIAPPRPALVPVTIEAAWVRDLKGITIPDVAVRVLDETTGDGNPPSKGKGKRDTPLAEDRGSFLFTHFGLSGPVVLNVSSAISGHAQPARLHLECDFLPELPEPAIDELIRREAGGKKLAKSLLVDHLPQRLADALLQQAGISPEQRLAELSKVARARWVQMLKRLPLRVSGTLGFKKAEVTAGGVLLDEVDSSSMQSKLVPGLYFAGEVLDLDGPIGGYNFQAAFSTGWLAAERV
jgi:predicted Rossmann fold flavoprotein